MTIRDAKRRLAVFPDNAPCAMALWTTGDVVTAIEQMGKKYKNVDAASVLDLVDHEQDASLGITWETIRTAIHACREP